MTRRGRPGRRRRESWRSRSRRGRSPSIVAPAPAGTSARGAVNLLLIRGPVGGDPTIGLGVVEIRSGLLGCAHQQLYRFPDECRLVPPSLVESTALAEDGERDRKSTRLNSSHVASSYAVF